MKTIYRLIIFLVLAGLSAAADGRFIVRTASDPTQVAADHALLDDVAVTAHNVFQGQSTDATPPQQVLTGLQSDPRVQNAEPDVTVVAPEVPAAVQLNASTAAAPQTVFDPTPVSYFGSMAANGYVNQPAVALIRLSNAQKIYGAIGAGIVAIIDTGVDPNHPVLQPVLIPGYDFTRNQAGIPSELADLPSATAAILTQSTAAILDKNQFAVLNQSTAAILDQSTAAILDLLQLPPAFGHGTMVAGIVHLAAPAAQIMPLKAFQADGTASLFNIIQAIYYAVDNGADVINLSFNLVTSSGEFTRAINYARLHNVVVVASVGNASASNLVYPAGMKSVIGVASSDNNGNLSKFSNFGSQTVDLVAPGEGIITTYPGSNYAAAWGTSFSAPFVAGGTALLQQFQPDLPSYEAMEAFSRGKRFDLDLGYGSLDLTQAVGAVKGNR